MSLFTELTLNEQASLAGGTKGSAEPYAPKTVKISKSFNTVTGGAGGDATGGIFIKNSTVTLTSSTVSAPTTGGAGGDASIS